MLIISLNKQNNVNYNLPEMQYKEEDNDSGFEIVGIKKDDKVSNKNTENTNENNTQEDTKIQITNDGSKIITISDEEEITIKSKTSSPQIVNAPDIVLTQDFINYFKENIRIKQLPQNNEAQFDLLLNEILEFIFNKYMCFTVGIAWKKRSGKIEIKHKKSHTNDFNKTFIELKSCLLSEALTSGLPVVRNYIEMNLEKELLTYYSTDLYHNIKSFGSVPIFFNNSEIVATLFIDFKNENLITDALIKDFIAYSKLISYLINIYNNRTQKDNYKDKFYHLMELLDTDVYLHYDNRIISKFAKNLLIFIDYDFLSIVVQDPIEQVLKINYVFNNTPNKYIGEGNIVEHSSVAYSCILHKEAMLINSFDESNFLFRFNENENISFNGSIMAVPIKAADYVFGCILIENIKKDFYNKQHLELLVKLMCFWGNLLEYDNKFKRLKQNIEYDTELDILNFNKFFERVQIELEKNILINNVLCSIAIIRIDYAKYANDFVNNAAKLPLRFLINNVKHHLKRHDLIGKYDDDKIIVYFFNMDSTKAMITLEKIRVDISRKQFNYNNKEYLFTITAGLVNATGKAKLNVIIEDALLSLEQGLQKGGNNIQRIDT